MIGARCSVRVRLMNIVIAGVGYPLSCLRIDEVKSRKMEGSADDGTAPSSYRFPCLSALDGEGAT